MTARLLRPRALAALLLLVAGGSTSAAAQKPAAASAKSTATSQVKPAALAGAWAGTVTVQFGDSTINAPVMYTFVESAGATTGTAMVPGQGTGPISNVVRSGAGVKFRVTATRMEEGKQVSRNLEHDGAIASDGVFSGAVTLDGKLVARFRITPRK